MPTSAHVWEDRVRNDNKGVMSRHFAAESRRERHRTAFELRLCDYKMGTGEESWVQLAGAQHPPASMVWINKTAFGTKAVIKH